MLNLSKITLLLLVCIGLTACGAVNKLKNTIEGLGDGLDDDCSFCEFDEEGELILPTAVPVDADIFTIANAIRGTIGTKSGILEDIENSSAVVTYGEMSLDNAEGGFAYFTSDAGEYEYVGILDNTDLGDALYYVPSTGVTTATWDATIVLIAEGSPPQEVSFPLTVNFNSREITGRNIEFEPVPGVGGIPATSRTGTLEGKFGVAGADNAGRLNGTFDIAEDANRPIDMYGLIGEDGAVGVFSGAYFGGFVAEPPQ